MRPWILIGVVLLVVLSLFLLQLFGPNSNVTLSKQTTYITAPLAEDGLPNYALAIVQRQSEGVTRENNGARLFWRAIGPASASQEQYDDLRDVLEIEQNATDTHLVDVADKATAERVADWIAAQRARTTPSADESADQPAFAEPIDEANERLTFVSTRPWTTDQLPPLAEWLAENEAPLDLLVEAAAKPRFFSPSPNLLTNPHTPVVEMMLPHAQDARSAVRSLSARAMNRVAIQEYDQAWQDILACWRLGAHIGDGPAIVEKLVGVAVRGVAKDCTLALLQAEDLPAPLTRQVLTDLKTQPSTVDMLDGIDYADRLLLLDVALRTVTGRLGGIEDYGDANASTIVSVDPNVPLRIGNEWHDRLVRAVEAEDRTERLEMIADFEADLEKLATGVKSKSLVGLVSRAKRSEAIGEILVSLMMPAMGAVIDAQDRDEANVALTHAAALLALHRIETGEYPASLKELLPAQLAQVPLDPYSGKPLIYERRGGGYLLYSVFQNGVDDGGRDVNGAVLAGEWVPPADTAPVAPDESDLVIRLPLPPLKVPDAERQ